MHVYLQYANNKKNTNIVVHYIGLANYGKAGWASVAMPILPSACMSKISDDFRVVFFVVYGAEARDFRDDRENRTNETNGTNEINGINGKFPSSEAPPPIPSSEALPIYPIKGQKGY